MNLHVQISWQVQHFVKSPCAGSLLQPATSTCTKRWEICSMAGSQSAAPATKSALQETSENSEHDPRPSRNRRSADLDLPASEPSVPLKNTAFRAFAISPQRTLYGACHEICTWRFTKCCTCHEICTWRFTKCCACHEICTWRFTKCCTCHDICTWRFTKCCACYEICTSRNK